MIELMIAALGIGGIAVLAMKAGFSGSGWAAITLGAVIASLALPFPIFVKPANMGSSIGVSKVCL